MPGGKLADHQPSVRSHLLDHPIEGLAGESDKAGCLSPPEEAGVVCLSESRRSPAAPLLQRLEDLVDQSVVPVVAGKRGHAEPTLLCRYRGGWRRIAGTEVLLQDIDSDADDARLEARGGEGVLDQDAADLASVHEEVIGPLHFHLSTRGKLTQERLPHGESGEDIEVKERPAVLHQVTRVEKQGHRQVLPCGSVPAVPRLTTPGGLIGRGDDSVLLQVRLLREAPPEVAVGRVDLSQMDLPHTSRFLPLRRLWW